MLVELTVEHRRLAEEAAERAADNVRRLQLRASRAYETLNDLDPFVRDYLGALAEIAVAEYTGEAWGRYELGAVDVGNDIEVRRATSPHNGVVIRPKDYHDVRLRRAVGVWLEDDTRAHLLGWVSIDSAWIKGRVCACEHSGRCCRIFRDSNSIQIHPRHLKSPETLKGQQ